MSKKTFRFPLSIQVTFIPFIGIFETTTRATRVGEGVAYYQYVVRDEMSYCTGSNEHLIKYKGGSGRDCKIIKVNLDKISDFTMVTWPRTITFLLDH